MQIGRIKGATRVLGKSQGYYGLPLRDGVVPAGELPQMLHVMCNSTVTGPETPCMETCWFPTPDELARLNAGAPIYLNIAGIAHPPVMLSVGEPVE